MSQKNYISHYEHLKNKWTDREQKLHEKLWQKHKEALEWVTRHATHVTTGSAASFLLLTATPSLPAIPPTPTPTVTTSPTPTELFKPVDPTAFLITDLYNKMPSTVQPLSIDQEERITGILSARFNMRVTAELNGVRLNQNYGYIGEEQHLVRYPGDSMETMFTSDDDAKKYWSSGMAPGRGAWGYFADSKADMTAEDIAREEWYIAVPTFLSPGYNDHVGVYSAFFKYRKMLVVNPDNGKAVVTDIGDSGPAEWTGKQLGGSPEVMSYLDRVDGAQKGAVLYFFIDDSKDTIPLGPIQIKQ